MKVLIIEDNPMWLNKINNIAIEKLPDFSIVSTDSISENINIKEYDLFILDIEVKDKNGEYQKLDMEKTYKVALPEELFVVPNVKTLMNMKDKF